jgi:hypothetical protein
LKRSDTVKSVKVFTTIKPHADVISDHVKILHCIQASPDVIEIAEAVAAELVETVPPFVKH